jgi:gas vesicle protein
MSNDNGTSAAILMAFVLGAIAGAATALLWAPQTGEETRRLIADKAREGREKAAEAAQKGREKAAEAAQKGREFVDRQRDTLHAAVERGKEAYQRARGTEEPA